MNFVDSKYVSLLTLRFDKFVKKKENLYNLRCPYCGDSQKHRNKARGYFYEKKGDFVFKCHNCGVGRTLSNFLKDHAADLHAQYILESYKETSVGRGTFRPQPKFESTKPKFKHKQDGIIPVNDLNKEHPAFVYLQQRQIPESKYSELFYAEKYKTWVNTQKQTFNVTDPDHPRLIIPLISNGAWFGFQARALNPRNPLRYITTILDDIPPKIFNLDGVNYNEVVYVTEGPIDSLFIDNCIAMVGADVDWMFLISNYETDFVFVYDNEPRNKQIVDRIEKMINSKCSVVIWPKSLKEKDINDMVLSGHDVNSLIESNTYSGLEAKVKLAEWKKV